ncbi:MAG: hypothetical protein ACTSU5_22135 [Promethearchaeota archaeon]
MNPIPNTGDGDPETLAMEAMSLIEEADQLEGSNPSEAAYNYQLAADKLARSRLVPQEKIDQIYTHVTYLNQLAQYQKEQAAQAQAQGPSPEALQEAGFEALDKAKEAEKQGQLQYALELHFYAINVLAQGGWNEMQLKGLQDEVRRLQLKMRTPSPAATRAGAGGGANAAPPPPGQTYTPTFASIPGGQAPPARVPAGGGMPGGRAGGTDGGPGAGTEQYMPTFATLPGARKPPAPTSPGSPSGSPGPDRGGTGGGAYVPTFTQLPSSQAPDVVAAPSSRIKLGDSAGDDDGPASLDDIMSMFKDLKVGGKTASSGGVERGNIQSEAPPRATPAAASTTARKTPPSSTPPASPEKTPAAAVEAQPGIGSKTKPVAPEPAPKEVEDGPESSTRVKDPNLKNLENLLDSILGGKGKQ